MKHLWKVAKLNFFKDFIYVFMRDTQREAETQAEGEAGSMQEPDVGFNSGNLGSCPEPKAEASLTELPRDSLNLKILGSLGGSAV